MLNSTGIITCSYLHNTSIIIESCLDHDWIILSAVQHIQLFFKHGISICCPPRSWIGNSADGSAFALAMAPPPRNLTKLFTFCQTPAVSIESIFDTPHPSQHLLGMGKASADVSTERCSSEGCVAASASGISDNYNQSLACDQRYPMTNALITDSRGQVPAKNLPRRSLPLNRTSPVDPRIRSNKATSIHQSHQRDEPASEGRTMSKSNPVRRPVSFVSALEISDLVAVEVQLVADKRCSQNEKSPDAEDELQCILEISV